MDSTLKLPRKFWSPVAGYQVADVPLFWPNWALRSLLPTAMRIRASLAADLSVTTVDAADIDFSGSDFDLVVTSPGWRPDSPLLVSAASAGIEVIGDVELAWRLDRAEIFTLHVLGLW